MTTLQPSKSTIFNRYPHLFLSVLEWTKQRRSDAYGKMKILSFGCSDGSEMASLSCYFPTSLVLGCDVAREGFDANAAASRAGHYFDSSEDAITEHGPYDVIFANSVLCAYPLRTSINEELPFTRFSRWASHLAASLKPSGLLVIFNSSYFFQDLKIYDQFKPVRTPLIYSSGWVPKWNRDQTLAIDLGPDRQPIFVSDDITFGKQVDCMFEKSGAGKPCNLHYGVTVTGPYEEISTTQESRSGAVLTRSLVRTNEDNYFLKYFWNISSKEAEGYRGVPWYQPATKDALKYPSPALYDTLPPKPKSASDIGSKPARRQKGFSQRFLSAFQRD